MSPGLVTLIVVFLLVAGFGAPMGLAMLAAGFAYLIASHQDVGLVVDQTMNGLYNSYLLLAVPLFIFVANLMNAGGVLDRLLAMALATVGRFRGGLAHVNVVASARPAAATRPKVASACSSVVAVKRRDNAPSSPRAPPHQQAATPAEPNQKPGRSV